MTCYKAIRPDGTSFHDPNFRWLPVDGVIPDGGWVVEHPHPSSPEQEPTSPAAVVLFDGEAAISTGDVWESRNYAESWEDLRRRAAEISGATLYDLASLPTGLLPALKDRVSARRFR